MKNISFNKIAKSNMPKLFSVFLFVFIIVFLFIFNCECLQKSLDICSIQRRNDQFENDKDYGNPEALRNYIASIDLKKDTEPLDFRLEDIKTTTLGKPLVKPRVGLKLIQEKILLPSKMKTGNPDVDKAVFYLVRKGNLKNRNVIFVAPGGPISECYLSFLNGYFNDIIQKDYDILFYVPPYFLDRKDLKEEKEFFTMNTQHNVFIMLKSINELRTAILFLKKHEVNSIGVFGGSLGGSMALLVAVVDHVDHISVMEPVVDWCFTLVRNTHLSKLNERLNNAGFDDELLCEAYAIISPAVYSPYNEFENLQILYPKYDQYTPTEIMYPFKEKWRIKYFDEYEKSHVTVLFNNDMFKGYFSFLEKMETHY